MEGQYIKQISIFLENKKGRLAEVADTLSQPNINIRALCVADTTDFGIVRLIVDHPDKAYEVLKAAGFTTSATQVIAVEMPDKPGALAKVLNVLRAKDINLEYVYAFIGKRGEYAIHVLRVENTEEALKALAENNIKAIDNDELLKL